MVDLNATLVPILGPVGAFVKTISVLVGGVFGIYLLLLYLRWREYWMMRRVLMDIRKDMHKIAMQQGIKLEPLKEPKLKGLIEYIKESLRKKEAPKKKVKK